MPVLTLQYPDIFEGQLRIIASTHNFNLMRQFKAIVLDEARTRTYELSNDEILQRDAQLEYERLKELLDLLIPEQLNLNNKYKQD